jgi:hypothetical protein
VSAEVMPVPARADAPAALHHGRVNRCGHCRAGHCRSCKGAVRVPRGKSAPSGLVVCLCPNCLPQVRCLDCGNQFSQDVDPRKWRCLDRTVCQGRVAMRQRDDRLWQLIQACKTDGARRRKEERERREQVRAQAGGEIEDRPAVRNPRPITGQCECCGVPTKGGKFAPGHDARLKSRLKKAAADGDKDAHKQLVERGWIKVA